MKSRGSIGIGIVGAGLMGREMASAIARWIHLEDFDVVPQLRHVADVDAPALSWYERVVGPPRLSANHHDLLKDTSVDVVYCAVPHHLHGTILRDILESGKHLLAEKPFGMNLDISQTLADVAAGQSDQLVRISSEMPFSPGGQEAWHWIRQGSFGRIIEVRASFLHSSDMDPYKPISWKRRARYNGDSGCMGDLGMHTLHIPLRAGWMPSKLYAQLSNLVTTRQDSDGTAVACDTWDNAILNCTVRDGDEEFPMRLEMKRISPGDMNTWRIEVDGMLGSMAFSSKNPKSFRWMDYKSGEPQVWAMTDLGSKAAYPSITGSIFESGFSDCVQQMFAAFLDELVNGREGMLQPFYCVTPAEAVRAHRIYEAALESQAEGTVVALSESGTRTRRHDFNSG